MIAHQNSRLTSILTFPKTPGKNRFEPQVTRLVTSFSLSSDSDDASQVRPVGKPNLSIAFIGPTDAAHRKKINSPNHLQKVRVSPKTTALATGNRTAGRANKLRRNSTHAPSHVPGRIRGNELRPSSALTSPTEQVQGCLSLSFLFHNPRQIPV